MLLLSERHGKAEVQLAAARRAFGAAAGTAADVVPDGDDEYDCVAEETLSCNDG